MDSFTSIGFLSGVLMIVGGTSVLLQGAGFLPVSRDSERQKTWLNQMGPIFRMGGPILIVAGLLKLLISL